MASLASAAAPPTATSVTPEDSDIDVEVEPSRADLRRAARDEMRRARSEAKENRRAERAAAKAQKAEARERERAEAEESKEAQATLLAESSVDSPEVAGEPFSDGESLVADTDAQDRDSQAEEAPRDAVDEAEAKAEARRERAAARQQQRGERAEAKAEAKREKAAARQQQRGERAEAKAEARRLKQESRRKHAADENDGIVEPPRAPRKPFLARGGSDEDSDSTSSGVRNALAILVGALGLLASIVLAVGAVFVALGVDSGQIFDALSSVCDFLVGPLRGVFSFSGENADNKEALVAWGLGSMGYLVIGLTAQSFARTETDD